MAKDHVVPPIPDYSEPVPEAPSPEKNISRSGPIDPGSTQPFWERTLRYGKMPPGKEEGRITDTGPERPQQYDPYTFVGPQPDVPYSAQPLTGADPTMADPSMAPGMMKEGQDIRPGHPYKGMETEPPFGPELPPSPASVLHVRAEEPDEDSHTPVHKHLGGPLGAINA
jgi:hypothetical protein